jgi:hypothetical protein
MGGALSSARFRLSPGIRLKRHGKATMTARLDEQLKHPEYRRRGHNPMAVKWRQPQSESFNNCTVKGGWVVPVILRRPEVAKRRGRGGHFDRKVEALAATVKRVRSEGVRDIRGLMKRLNETGIPAPNGKAFSFGSLRRVLRRMQQLYLGPGPRTMSAAASQRPPRPYTFRPGRTGSTFTLRRLQQECEARSRVSRHAEQNGRIPTLAQTDNAGCAFTNIETAGSKAERRAKP